MRIFTKGSGSLGTQGGKKRKGDRVGEKKGKRKMEGEEEKEDI